MKRPDIYVSDIVTELERHDLLPAIMFRTSRNQCDVDIQHALASRSLRLPVPEQHRIRELIHQVIRNYEMDEDLIFTHPQYNTLLTTGIGAHHAGQLLMWRLLLEELMSAGLMRMLIATGTVAAGVDFPARTVVITAHSRRGSEGFASLTSAELQQMSGRAGRRGKDTVGFCIVAPAPFCDARTVLRIAKRPPEPLQSAYFPGPSTVLNLLRYRNVDDLRFTVSRSLAAFRDRKDAQAQRREADTVCERLAPETRKELAAQAGFNPTDVADQDEPSSGTVRREDKKLAKRYRRLYRQANALERRQEVLLDSALTGLQSLGYVEGSSLSDKGFWAANLCTNIVLELGEILVSGMLTDVTAEKLAAIVASISADEHRQYLEVDREFLTKDEVAGLTGILNRVAATAMPGISGSRVVVPNAASTVVTWMNTENWQQFRGLLALSGVAEGDAARLITQTAEQLNQLARLEQTFPKLVLRAEEAKRRILRPPLTEVINLDTP